MPSPEDQHPVQAFGPRGADPPLAESVRIRGADRRSDHPHALGGEHLVEGRGELRVPVVEKEPHVPPFLLQIHDEVPGLLGDPSGVRVRRDSAQTDPSRAKLDPHKHVERLQPDRLDGEEVAGDGFMGLRFQELTPGRPSSGSRPQTVTKEQRGNGGR